MKSAANVPNLPYVQRLEINEEKKPTNLEEFRGVSIAMSGCKALTALCFYVI